MLKTKCGGLNVVAPVHKKVVKRPEEESIFYLNDCILG
jgi:hypothetical protein